jgi:flavin-binding protein dodecin
MGNTYKKIELTGTSETSIEDAVGIALAKASDSVRNMRWFEVTEVRGAVDGQQVSQWQVTIKVGFTVE